MTPPKVLYIPTMDILKAAQESKFENDYISIDGLCCWVREEEDNIQKNIKRILFLQT